MDKIRLSPMNPQQLEVLKKIHIRDSASWYDIFDHVFEFADDDERAMMRDLYKCGLIETVSYRPDSKGGTFFILTHSGMNELFAQNRFVDESQ